MISLDLLDKKIMKALQEKEIFIGYYMLCRYLHGRGYFRYGCNAGYNKPLTNGKDRRFPCPILCPNTKIYYSKVRYHCKKLEKLGKLFLDKRFFLDSVNPNFPRKKKREDIFVFIYLQEQDFLDKKAPDCEEYPYWSDLELGGVEVD